MAASAWKKVARTVISVIAGTAGPGTVAISLKDADFQDVLARVLDLGMTPVLVSETDLDSKTRARLATAGFAEHSLNGGWFYDMPADEPAQSDPFVIALTGSFTSRLFAGMDSTKTATLADIAISRRPILSDGTPSTRWLDDLLGTSGTAHRVKTVERWRPVVPLDVPDQRPITIDRSTSQPVVAIGDCETSRLIELSAGLAEIAVSTAGSGPISDPVAVLRAFRTRALDAALKSSGVVLPSSAFRCSLDRASVLVDAVSKGVPVLADDVGSLEPYLGRRLVKALSGVDRVLFESLEYRDRTAVRQTRALGIDALGYPPVDALGLIWPLPSVTLLLPTMRPHLLTQARAYVASQTYPNLEVLLLAHGWASAPEAEEWSNSIESPVRVLEMDASMPLGQVCNVGIAHAEGEIVSKWDDDDHYGPDHIWDLVLALRASTADLVGKAAEFVYLQDLDTTIQRSGAGRYSYSTFLAGGTLAMHRSVAIELGGFPALSRSVDQGLIERVRKRGGRTYRTHGLGYLLHRHTSGHTWKTSSAYFIAHAARQWPGIAYSESGITEGPD
jgi:hypothetical protein